MARVMIGGAFEPQEQAEFERIKVIVLREVPDAEQVVSYGMPTFKYQKKVILHVGAFKDHMSIFPGAAVGVAFAKELKGYKTSKGTIQFTLDKRLPDELIADIVKFRKESILRGE